MVTGRADLYACASGGGVYAGIASSGLPAVAMPASARIAIWGQSNAIGRADRADIAASPLSSDSGLAAYDAGTFSRVYIWTGSAFVQLQPSVNNGADAGQFGPEFGLAVRWMRETTTGNLYIEKVASSGVSIDYFDPAGGNYPGFVVVRGNADAWLVSNSLTVALEAHLWVQGESDAAQTEAWYSTRLTTLLAARVTDGFQAAGDLNVLVQMIAGTVSYGAGVDAAKAAYAAANPGSAVEMDCANYFKADNLHLNGRGQVQLGYDAFEQIFGAAHVAA